MELNIKENANEEEKTMHDSIQNDFHRSEKIFSRLLICKLLPKNRKFIINQHKSLLSLPKEKLSLFSEISMASSIVHFNKRKSILTHDQLNKTLAQKISTDLSSSFLSLDNLIDSCLNKFNLSKYHEILSCIKSYITAEIKARLFNALLATKNTINNNWLSSNLISILNYSDFDFIDKDMTGIEISGSDLSGALIINSNFEGTNFDRVNLTQSNIYNSSFKNCNMKGAEFGQSIFSAHQALISKLFYSPDGRNFATLGTNSQLTFWNIEKQTKVKTIQLSAVSYLAFSKSWKMVGAVDNQHIINLWNLETENIINSFVHGDLISSIEFSTDEKYLISCGCDNKIKMWDIYLSEPIKIFKAHRSSVTEAKFTLSDTYIISCGYDCLIIKWDVKSEKNFVTLEDDWEVLSINILKNERYLVSIRNEGISLWDVIENEKIMQLGIDYYFISFVFSNCGKYMAYCDQNYNIRIWSLIKWKEIKVCKKINHNIDTLCFSPCGRYLASAGPNDKIKIFNFRSLIQSKNVEWYKNSISSIILSSDNKYAATLCKTKEFALWNIEKSNLQCVIPVKNIGAIAFSPCGKFLAAAIGWNVSIWELKTFNKIKEITGFFDTISEIFYSGDGNSVIFMIKNAIKMVDINNPSIWKIFKISSKCKAPIVISPLNNYIAACHLYKNQIIIWKVKSGEKMRHLHGVDSKIMSISFLSHEKHFAVLDQNRKVTIWKISIGEILRKIETENATSLLCSPKYENLLLWNSVEETLTILNHKSLRKHKEVISRLKLVAVSKSQNIFITASMDSSVKVWKLTYI